MVGTSALGDGRIVGATVWIADPVDRYDMCLLTEEGTADLTPILLLSVGITRRT